jgi:hypothetical protein
MTTVMDDIKGGNMQPRWKKNLIKIPDNIRERINRLGNSNMVVACSQKIKTEDILNGVYNHLNIQIVDGKLEYPQRILPKPDTGRYSSYNLYGREIVYRNEPMIGKTYNVESPNYGDWDKGSHEVSWDRDVYKRAFIGPKYFELTIEFLGIDDKNQHVFKFSVDDVLNISRPDFWDDLLFDLNLLQENVGSHGVFPTNADLNDYLKSLYVSWEILPPGEIEENVTRILTGIQSSDSKLRQRITDRFKFLLSLKPKSIIQGTSKFQRYYGAMFAEDLVVFENAEYGNAIYLMFANWEDLSKKSRTELLSSSSQDFIRIRHTKTWKLVLRATVIKELKKHRTES